LFKFNLNKLIFNAMLRFALTVALNTITPPIDQSTYIYIVLIDISNQVPVEGCCKRDISKIKTVEF